MYREFTKYFEQPWDLDVYNSGKDEAPSHDTIMNNSMVLLDAVKNNKFDKVLNIVTKQDSRSYDINIHGENLWTPLHFACWIGNLMIVNLLYYNQADLNSSARNSITPIMVCCLKGNSKLLLHLLQLKADFRVTDSSGNCLLHYAARSGNSDCLRILLQKTDLDIYSKNIEGKAPVEMIQNEAQRDVVIEYSKKSAEKEEENCIKITSVDNENFLILNGQKKVIQSYGPACKEPGSQLGGEEVGPRDFLIHASLGKGAFGEVYLVERKSTGMLYAMKVLYKSKIIRNTS